jgi:hypothetical protein
MAQRLRALWWILLLPSLGLLAYFAGILDLKNGTSKNDGATPEPIHTRREANDKGLDPPIREDLPPEFTVEAIEATYPKVLQHVHKVAQRNLISADEESAFAQELPPEVIGMKTGRNRPNSPLTAYALLGDRGKLPMTQGRCAWPRLPQPGEPVLDRYSYTQAGQQNNYIVYHALVAETGDPLMEFFVYFDEEGLRKRLHANLSKDK